MKTKTLRNGDQITYTYDNAGNTTQIQGVQAGKTTVAQNYTYDLAGHVITANNGDCTISYVYDDMGNCTQETDTFGGNTYVKNCAYNGHDLYTYAVQKNGSQTAFTAYSYESSGRVSQINYFAYGAKADYTYYDNGQTRNINTYDSSSSDPESNLSYSYYPSNQVLAASFNTSINGTVNFSKTESYVYRLDGNLNEKYSWASYGSTDPAENYEYNYDDLGRMNTETYGIDIGGEINNQWRKLYYFDDYNNISNLTYTDYTNSANNTVTTSTYNKANRLNDQTITHNGTLIKKLTFAYDNAGNLTSKKNGTTVLSSMTYDALNRTASVTNGSTTSSFKYDSNDHRISKTTGTNVTSSIWKDDKISVDYKYNGTTTTPYYYFENNEGLLVKGNFYVNNLNAQGDVVSTTGYNGAKTDYSFDAYGNKTSSSAQISPIGYRGYYFDSETGLYYLNARYYDPTTQQFTQEDTYWGDIKYPQSLNLYAYCADNPVLNTDPSGHDYVDESWIRWQKQMEQQFHQMGEKRTKHENVEDETTKKLRLFIQYYKSATGSNPSIPANIKSINITSRKFSINKNEAFIYNFGYGLIKAYVTNLAFSYIGKSLEFAGLAGTAANKLIKNVKTPISVLYASLFPDKKAIAGHYIEYDVTITNNKNYYFYIIVVGVAGSGFVGVTCYRYPLSLINTYKNWHE